MTIVRPRALLRPRGRRRSRLQVAVPGRCAAVLFWVLWNHEIPRRCHRHRVGHAARAPRGKSICAPGLAWRIALPRWGRWGAGVCAAPPPPVAISSGAVYSLRSNLTLTLTGKKGVPNCQHYAKAQLSVFHTWGLEWSCSFNSPDAHPKMSSGYPWRIWAEAGLGSLAHPWSFSGCPWRHGGSQKTPAPSDCAPHASLSASS